MATYSPFEEYLGIMVKLGPLANSNFCACMKDEGERFTTYFPMMLSGGDVPGLLQIFANKVVAVVIVVLDVGIFVWLLVLSSH